MVKMEVGQFGLDGRLRGVVNFPPGAVIHLVPPYRGSGSIASESGLDATRILDNHGKLMKQGKFSVWEAMESGTIYRDGRHRNVRSGTHFTSYASCARPVKIDALE